MRINFQEVALHSSKSGKCGCGKRRSRSQKFWQTLSPWNKNDDGSIKDASQIRNELAEQIRAWKAEPITCEKCKAEHGDTP